MKDTKKHEACPKCGSDDIYNISGGYGKLTGCRNCDYRILEK